jgi:Domain of unknown function (DUF4328)
MSETSGVVPSFYSPLKDARRAVLCLQVGIGLNLVSIAAGAWQAHLAAEVIAGRTPPQPQIDLSDQLTLLVTLAQLLVFIATAYFFLAWFYRAYANLPALGARDPEASPGWAVGAWFIPLVNLARPYRRAREIWRGSDPDTDPRDPAAWHRAPVSPLLGCWWAAFLVSSFVGNAYGRLAHEAKRPDEILSSLWLGMISDGLEIAAALLAIQVVRRITERQRERYRRLYGDG